LHGRVPKKASKAIVPSQSAVSSQSFRFNDERGGSLPAHIDMTV
jgi:hypothetical protein